MVVILIIAVWAIPMVVMAMTGSPRAVLVLSALYLLFLIYRGFVVTGPMASMALIALLVVLVFHVLGTLAMYLLAKRIRLGIEQ